jgi:protein tyrosine phosphatase (PTP) superfamily phosphohydrolase (DUF442 family)
MKIHSKIATLLLLALIQACSTGGNQGEFAEYDMINAAAPQQNLVTGGQPTLEDLNRLAKRGVKVVINLRTKGEFNKFNERQAVERLGMEYVSIEIDGSDGITPANAIRLDKALGELKQPALVHCASSNRVGGLLAFRAFSLQNKSAEESLQIGKLAGMRSTEKKVKILLGIK